MIKLKSILVLLIATTFFNVSFSQENWWEKEAEIKEDTVDSKDSIIFEKGKVNIEKDPRIDKLIDFLGDAIAPAFEPQMDGFRVQLFFDQERSETNEARAKFVKETSDIPTYIEYKAPIYYLTAGNFRDKLSAERLRAEVIEEFPEAIVVETRIYLPGSH